MSSRGETAWERLSLRLGLHRKHVRRYVVTYAWGVTDAACWCGYRFPREGCL